MTDPQGQQPRPCLPVVIPPGPTGLETALPALDEALSGAGPAVAPLPEQGEPAYRERLNAALRPRDPVSQDVAVVVATSGSTGDPAGVILPAESLRAAAVGFQERFGTHRWVAALPLHHAGGLMVAVRSIVDGTTPVAMTSLGGAGRFTVSGFASATALATGGHPLAVSLVPAMLDVLDQAGPEGHELLMAYDVVLVGGAATPASTAARLLARGIRIVTSYGMTETCGGAAFDGLPLAGTTITADAGGTLTICGTQVAAGYRDGRAPERWHHRGELRCFRTGDLGRVDSTGRVDVLGRSDDVVQVGGVSVSLDAVASILREHRDVAQAEVVTVPDARYGARLVALVVPSPLREAPEDLPQDVHDGLARDLPESVTEHLGRAARPRSVLLVDAIPMLESGKPDRRALRAMAARMSP